MANRKKPLLAGCLAFALAIAGPVLACPAGYRPTAAMNGHCCPKAPAGDTGCPRVVCVKIAIRAAIVPEEFPDGHAGTTAVEGPGAISFSPGWEPRARGPRFLPDGMGLHVRLRIFRI